MQSSKSFLVLENCYQGLDIVNCMEEKELIQIECRLFMLTFLDYYFTPCLLVFTGRLKQNNSSSLIYISNVQL